MQSSKNTCIYHKEKQYIIIPDIIIVPTSSAVGIHLSATNDCKDNFKLSSSSISTTLYSSNIIVISKFKIRIIQTEYPAV